MKKWKSTNSVERKEERIKNNFSRKKTNIRKKNK